jgi:hypothetical protein
MDFRWGSGEDETRESKKNEFHVTQKEARDLEKGHNRMQLSRIG